MRNITAVDPGFDYENRVMLSMDTDLIGYEEERGQDFYRDLLARTRNLPGVRNAATARFVHIGYNNGSRRIYLEGQGEGIEEEEELHNAMFNVVSSDYFSTLGISLLDGRVITERDDASARPVTVINNTMAEEVWPDQSALGKRFSVEGPGGPFIEIVGVVETGFYMIPGEPPQPMFYRPLKQDFAPDQTLFVHTEPEPTSLIPALRAEIRSLDADMPIYDVFTLESHVKEGKAELLFNLPARLVGAFALIGAVLAGLGLYAVIAYSVTQRTHEIGLRVALGASSSSIVRLVIQKGVILGLVGIGLGVLLAYAVTRTFANLLIGISASDPMTYAAVALAVLLVALASCFIPAQFRAARIDPAVALREE
jgi:putative ABC transport system permease protein